MIRWLIEQSDIVIGLKTLEEEALSEFRRHRSSFIEERITQLTQQLEEELKYHIDITVAQKNLGQDNLVCSNCCHIYLRSEKNICPKCNHDHCHTTPHHDPYFRTELRVAGAKPNVVIGEPCLVNPNSRDSVKTVLKHI